jgi:hypothetical protein
MNQREDREFEPQHSEAEERRIREAALDRTIEVSFPASDPPSSDPNRDAADVFDNDIPADRETPSQP